MQTHYAFRRVSEKLSIKINYHQTLETATGDGLMLPPLSCWLHLCVILLTSDLHCSSEKRITCQIYDMPALTQLGNCDPRVSNINVAIHPALLWHFELHTQKCSALREFFCKGVSGIYLFISFMFLLNQHLI